MAKRRKPKATANAEGKAASAKVNKSAAIREALKTIDRPKDVVAELAKSGITVSPAMVSQIKTKSTKAKGKKRGRPKGATTTKAATNSGNVVDAILNLAKLARQHTVAKLRTWLDKLED